MQGKGARGSGICYYYANMMRRLLPLLLAVTVLQPACFWKLWSKEKPLEERTFDIYGTVKTIAPDRLVVDTKKGEETFIIGPASIKGSDFNTGAYVHVYYKIKDDQKEVTMVVEKID